VVPQQLLGQHRLILSQGMYSLIHTALLCAIVSGDDSFSSVKVFVLGIHSAHHDTIASMLQKLLAAYSASALVASGATSGTDISFWPFVCGQVVSLSINIAFLQS
jgi:hypothetical protein